MGIRIIYAIETNAEYYTSEESDEQYIDELTGNIDKNSRAYMKKHYKNVTFDTKFVPESTSYGNKTEFYADSHEEEQEAENIVESLQDYVGHNFPDWWPQEATSV